MYVQGFTKISFIFITTGGWDKNWTFISNNIQFLRYSENSEPMLTLKIRYQLAHRETENEILENLTQESEGHAEHTEQKIRYSLKQRSPVILLISF